MVEGAEAEATEAVGGVGAGVGAEDTAGRGGGERGWHGGRRRHRTG
jgi:hypothetical protein